MLIPSSPSHPIPALIGNPAASQAAGATSTNKDSSSGNGFWGKDGFSLGDLVDAVNPLHTLPIVSSLYEHATGTESSPGSKMLGGAIYGGVIGVVASFADSVVKGTTGSSVGEKLASAVEGPASTPAAPIAAKTAQVIPPPRPQAAALAPPSLVPDKTAMLGVPLLKPSIAAQQASVTDASKSLHEQVQFDNRPTGGPSNIQQMLLKQYKETLQIDALSLPDSLPESGDRKEDAQRKTTSLDISA